MCICDRTGVNEAHVNSDHFEFCKQCVVGSNFVEIFMIMASDHLDIIFGTNSHHYVCKLMKGKVCSQGLFHRDVDVKLELDLLQVLVYDFCVKMTPDS